MCSVRHALEPRVGARHLYVVDHPQAAGRHAAGRFTCVEHHGVA